MSTIPSEPIRVNNGAQSVPPLNFWPRLDELILFLRARPATTNEITAQPFAGSAQATIDLIDAGLDRGLLGMSTDGHWSLLADKDGASEARVESGLSDRVAALVRYLRAHGPTSQATLDEQPFAGRDILVLLGEAYARGLVQSLGGKVWDLAASSGVGDAAMQDRIAGLTRFLVLVGPASEAQLLEHSWSGRTPEALGVLLEQARLASVVQSLGGGIWDLTPHALIAAEEAPAMSSEVQQALRDYAAARREVARADETITRQADTIASLSDPARLREHLCDVDLQDATLPEVLLHGLSDGDSGRASAILRAARDDIAMVSVLVGGALDAASVPTDLVGLFLDRVAARIDTGLELLRRQAGAAL